MTTPEIERQERLQVTAADGTTHRFYTHDEVQAAIAAAMMGVVKPLEWIENPDTGEGGMLGGGVINATYHAMDDGWCFHRARFWRETENIEAAKAAAQADYQARILSALSIPTDTMAALEEIKRQVWNEALEVAAKWCDEKLAGAKASRDEAKALGASFEIQRAWRAVISHLGDAPAAIRAMKKEGE
jgi:hypothetical protein